MSLEFSIAMVYDAAASRVCADVAYDGTPNSRMQVDPFPSWVTDPSLAPSVHITFMATQAGGTFSTSNSYPINQQLDTNLAHLVGPTFELWDGDPSDPTATKLYTGGPGTPANVPLDWTDPRIAAAFFPPGVLFATPGGVLSYTVVRKDFTDPTTYFFTAFHVCVPLVAAVFVPPTAIPAVSPLADVSFHQTHGLHADLYAHAVLGAPIDITNADWYMTTPRRHWVSGYDIKVSARANPPAELGKLKLIATGLPRVNAAGRSRYLKIGGKIGDKIAPH